MNEYEGFKNNYYLSDEILLLFENLSESFSNQLTLQNIRLVGNPGAGKTSFLYALKFFSENDESTALRNFFINIIHINRAYSYDGDFLESEADQLIITAWEQYYTACGQSEAFDNIETTSSTVKETWNRLSSYYLKNKSDFSKILLIALDDVDLVDGENIGKLIDYVLNAVEINSVKKILSIRRQTISDYNNAIKKKVEQFFPSHYVFPDVSLHGVITQRLAWVGDNALNPFSENLCNNLISPICDYNLREGLSMAKSTIETNLPKGIQNGTGSLFIQNYIEKAAVKNFISAGKIPDLHSPRFRIGLMPLGLDLLALTQYENKETILYGALIDCCDKRNIKSKFQAYPDDRKYRLSTEDFNYVKNNLSKAGLVVVEYDRIVPTEKGQIVAKIALNEFYFNASQDINAVSATPDYWKILSRNIDHKKILELFTTYRRQVNPA